MPRTSHGFCAPNRIRSPSSSPPCCNKSNPTPTLIEIYGTPYPDDIGPGQLYKQGYSGPDLIHYKYVDLPEARIPDVWSYANTTQWTIPLRDLPSDWVSKNYTSINFPVVSNLTFNIGPHGYAEKPATWASRRAWPGRIQQAISEQITSHMQLRQTINDTAGDLAVLQKAINVFEADNTTYQSVRDINTGLLVADEVLEKAKFANDLFQKYQDSISEDIQLTTRAIYSGLPTSFIAGLASGGDLTSAARSALEIAGFNVVSTLDKVALARYTVIAALEPSVNSGRRLAEFTGVEPLNREKELRNTVQDLGNQLGTLQERLWTINERLRDYDDKQRAVRAMIAEGDRIQAERQVFRQRAAAVVQGYRTRDAAFRLFRNEKLERYKTLFDLAVRYGLLAANAYDYETGLLGTPAGRSFKSRIIATRALGVVQDGEPRFGGSDTGDPGLSSALAEMKADWNVVRDRLGFSPSSFATKISGVGVALEGYHGLGDPLANGEAVAAAAAASADEPDTWFLDPLGLSATPYVYLIPVGVDSMRTPPLGDAGKIRTWNVEDLAIPMPFNLGGSEFSTLNLYQSADSLAEPLFAIRKHHAFRPVSDIAKFELVFYSDSIPRAEFINNRLIGRSVWNSQWKLVIPGRTLLNNPEEGLDRFIRTVTDIKLNFTTYSYAGN